MASSWSWKLSEEELKFQVDNYHTLKMTKSYRGISTLLFCFTIVLSLLLVGFQVADPLILIDLLFIAPVTYFLYKGKPWAFIAAIIIWTIEKVYQLATMPTSAIVVILWWYAYVQTFYKGWQVEKARLKNSSDSGATPLPPMAPEPPPAPPAPPQMQ